MTNFNRDDFTKCSYEFFYRSPIYAAVNENPTEANPAPLPCVFGNIAGLNCMAQRTSSTTTTTTTTTTIAPTEQPFVPISLPNKSSYLFTREGLQIGHEWFVRINASANNRLEVMKKNFSLTNDDEQIWGVVCDSTWNNDIARMFCNDFFGFTSKNASVFKANPPSSPNFNPNALSGFTGDENGTAVPYQTFPFLWGPAPACSGCANGNLDSKYCEVRDFLVEDCVVGDEIGLYCENLISPTEEDGENNTRANEEEMDIVVTIENGGYEWKLNESNGGLVEIRPLKNYSLNTENTEEELLPFGFIRFTSSDLVTSDTLCRWFGYGAGGNARTPQDIEENFLSSIPPLDRQPCYLSWIKCFARGSPSLAYCIFNTNGAEHCGGSQYAQYLNCSHSFPSKTKSRSISNSITLSHSDSEVTQSLSNSSTITTTILNNRTTPDNNTNNDTTMSSTSISASPSTTLFTTTIDSAITATASSPPTFIDSSSTTSTTTTSPSSTTTSPSPASPPRDPGGVLDFSSGSLTRGGTSVIGVGLGIGFAFLTVIIIFLVFAFRNKQIVVDCLEGIRSAEEHEIEDQREDRRIEEQFREERKYRSSGEDDDANFVMEMTPKNHQHHHPPPTTATTNQNDESSFYSIVAQQQNETESHAAATSFSSPQPPLPQPDSTLVVLQPPSAEPTTIFTPRNNDEEEGDIK